MNALLELKELKKYYKVPGGELHAVDGVSMSVAEGTTMGVVGESGCGKSTLGSAILRLTPATGGTILYRGMNISCMTRREFSRVRPEMQMIFQDPYSSLNGRMTVEELIAEPLLINHACHSRHETMSRVHELMDTVGLAERFATAYPHELDGGRRQRIGVARALSLEPKFIVCDEPVSALDVSIQAQILNLLMDLQEQRNLTYLFITHDMSVVKHISNRITVMYLGRVVEMADTDELFLHPLHPYTRVLLSAIPVPSLAHRGKPREIIRGEITSPVNPKPVCRFAARCPMAQEICLREEPELKDAGSGHLCACHFAGRL